MASSASHELGFTVSSHAYTAGFVSRTASLPQASGWGSLTSRRETSGGARRHVGPIVRATPGSWTVPIPRPPLELVQRVRPAAGQIPEFLLHEVDGADVGQPWRAAPWTSWPREVMPSLAKTLGGLRGDLGRPRTTSRSVGVSAAQPVVGRSRSPWPPFTAGFSGDVGDFVRNPCGTTVFTRNDGSLLSTRGPR